MKTTWALGAVFFMAASGSAVAQTYPARPISIVVPAAAGGPSDIVTRLVAEPMTRTLGQQVVVENYGGAGGTIGAARVAKAAPDGYTLMLYHIGVATSATLYRTLTYDPRKFESVGLVTEVPMVMIGNPKFPAKTAQEFLAYLKEKKEGVSFAHAGIGAASQLCGMLLMHALDVRLTTVAYRGTGPAMNDILGGQVDMICDQTTGTTEHILDGRVKGYAVTTRTRVKSLPNLPTMEEAGIKGFEVSAWHGIFAPQGTPKAVLDKLAAALRDALKDPKVIQRFGELGTEPVSADLATPQAMKKHFDAEIDKWAPIIKAAGVYAD